MLHHLAHTAGDIDGIVPLVGTRRWIDSLCLPVTHAWRPYYTESGEGCVMAPSIVSFLDLCCCFSS